MNRSDYVHVTFTCVSFTCDKVKLYLGLSVQENSDCAYLSKIYLSKITKHVPWDVNTVPQQIHAQTLHPFSASLSPTAQRQATQKKEEGRYKSEKETVSS